MRRTKILQVPMRLQPNSLEDIDISDATFEDSQPKRRRSDLQRWRRLKHQLA